MKNKEPVIKFRKLRPDAKLPEYKTPGSAGMDVFVCDHKGIVVYPEETTAIGTGLCIELPPGYEAQVRSRSGMALRGIVVANSPGTIDHDYQGEIRVIVRNQSSHAYYVQQGDRIAQLVIAQAPQFPIEESFDEPGATTRGAGGFGSTGR